MKKIPTIVISSLILLFIPTTFVNAQLSNGDLNEEEEFLGLYYDNNTVVETASHASKPLSRVAENVTIITAEDIERMNAHNVDDVLNRVAGVFVDYAGQDFNGNTYLDIHDSSYQQVAVYLDGVRLSKASADLAFANVVSIRIIKRIEVIKGAASSTWGSALGGVINIITKDTGKSDGVTGSLHGSHGEFNSRDYSGELAGKWRRLGYYLSASHQSSDGLRDNKYFDNETIYGKIDWALTNHMILSFSGGINRPDYKAGYFAHPDFDRTEDIYDNNQFSTGSYDWMPSSQLNLHINSYYFENDFQTTGTVISNRQPLWKNNELQNTTGINGRINWTLNSQQAVMGFDYVRNKLFRKDKLADGPVARLYEELFALYMNDTIHFSNLTIIPGLRFDSLSDATDMISPGFGATYQLSDHTLLRAGISRGFRKPPFTYTDTENGSRYANNELDPETVWSYQIGAETGAARFCRFKSTFFYHDAEDSFQWSRKLGLYDNLGRQKRRGLELELETTPWNHLVMEVNFTYVHLENTEQQNGYKREANLIIRYDRPQIITVELAGHYVRYGILEAPPAYNPLDSTILWDLSINKPLWRRVKTRSELFLVGHNLSNESQYDDELLKNGPRWLELGLKFFF